MADKSLFTRLRRLFSTDVVIRNTGGNQLKVFDVNKIQQSGNFETNALVDRFNRIYTNSGTSLYGQQTNFNYQYFNSNISLPISSSLNYETTKHIFNYTGNFQIWNKPENVNEINVYIWGAGGGSPATLTEKFSGGSGAYLNAKINVKNINSLILIVGQGGNNNKTWVFTHF